MSRAGLGEAPSKIRFTKPFLIKKKKSLKYISIISKLQLKTYIIQRNSSREWLMLKPTPPKKTTPPQKCHPPTLSLGSFMLGFHLRPEASEKMRMVKPQRKTASRLNFGQGKEKAVNRSRGLTGKELGILGNFLLRGEISETQISFLESS